jgi:hypothetical protein
MNMNENFDRFIRDVKDSISLYQIGVQDEEGTVANLYRDVEIIAKKLRENKK